MYLIMPDRFANGDPRMTSLPKRPVPTIVEAACVPWRRLRGIQNHLPYLKDLGVTALWLTPIVKNGARTGLSRVCAVDLYAVDAHLGALKDYQDLVAAVHKQGMRLFFDAVPNHVGQNIPGLRIRHFRTGSTERCSTISILFRR